MGTKCDAIGTEVCKKAAGVGMLVQKAKADAVIVIAAGKQLRLDLLRQKDEREDGFSWKHFHLHQVTESIAVFTIDSVIMGSTAGVR